MTFKVPDGLMQRLVFGDGPTSPAEMPPRIPADLPVIFSPCDNDESSDVQA